MKRFVVFVVLAMVVIGSCTAQSATNEAQKLVGTWVTDEGWTLVFNANGTGTSSGSGYGQFPDGNIFWGVSTSGGLAIKTPNYNAKETFYLSPDGRRMMYVVGNTLFVFQKR